MQIRDLFATAVVERIEPVVKVIDRRPEILAGELGSLVVTPQWEQFLRRALDAYTDAADRDDEEGIGIWISGFFGSGKSLLMKIFGTLLVGGDIGG
jgi:predicted ATPase